MQEGQIDGRVGRLLDPAILHIADHRDDFGVLALFPSDPEAYLFANRVFAGKEFCGRGLIDYRHARGSLAVPAVEGPPGEQRYFQRLEIIGSDAMKPYSRAVFVAIPDSRPLIFIVVAEELFESGVELATVADSTPGSADTRSSSCS